MVHSTTSTKPLKLYCTNGDGGDVHGGNGASSGRTVVGASSAKKNLSISKLRLHSPVDFGIVPPRYTPDRAECAAQVICDEEEAGLDAGPLPNPYSSSGSTACIAPIHPRHWKQDSDVGNRSQSSRSRIIRGAPEKHRLPAGYEQPTATSWTLPRSPHHTRPQPCHQEHLDVRGTWAPSYQLEVLGTNPTPIPRRTLDPLNAIHMRPLCDRGDFSKVVLPSQHALASHGGKQPESLTMRDRGFAGQVIAPGPSADDYWQASAGAVGLMPQSRSHSLGLNSGSLLRRSSSQVKRCIGVGVDNEVVTNQPESHPGMDIEMTPPNAGTLVSKRSRYLNVKGHPYSKKGLRDWSTDLCEFCDHNLATCCTALWCPCISYGRNKLRVEHLRAHDTPQPAHGLKSCSGDCATYAFLSLFCFAWPLQTSNRAVVRDRYDIEGDCLGDCGSVVCCSPCELAQESREIHLEERALLDTWTITGDKDIYTEAPKKIRESRESPSSMSFHHA